MSAYPGPLWEALLWQDISLYAPNLGGIPDVPGDGAVSPCQAPAESGPAARKGPAGTRLHKAGPRLSRNPFPLSPNLPPPVPVLGSFGTCFSLLSLQPVVPRPLPQPHLVFAVVVPISLVGSRCPSPHQISQGPTFTCMFLATVVVPAVRFSTTRLNFGACFIYHAGMPPARQTIVITNEADKDVRYVFSAHS